jgi:hypothetical protein
METLLDLYSGGKLPIPVSVNLNTGNARKVISTFIVQ